jgi:hypothetical protein
MRPELVRVAARHRHGPVATASLRVHSRRLVERANLINAKSPLQLPINARGRAGRAGTRRAHSQSLLVARSEDATHAVPFLMLHARMSDTDRYALRDVRMRTAVWHSVPNHMACAREAVYFVSEVGQ